MAVQGQRRGLTTNMPELDANTATLIRFEVLKLASDALKNLMNIAVLLCAGLIAFAGATKSFDSYLIVAVAMLIMAAIFAQMGLFACVNEGETGTPDASARRIRFCTIASFAMMVCGMMAFLLRFL